MTRVALKGLLGRKTRAILTSLAIVLGVAMISGTFVLTDTIQKSFDSVFAQAYDTTDVNIAGKEIVAASRSHATVPASLVSKVRDLPQTAAASGGVEGEVKLVDAHGTTIGGANAEGDAFSVDPKDPRFSPLTLTTGRWAAGPNEIVIDSNTATKHHYAVGDRIGAKGDGPVRKYTITGIGKLGGGGLGGLVTLAAFDLTTAQQILDREGSLDAISVAAKPGVSQDELARAIRPLLPPTLEAKTGDEAVQDASDRLSKEITTIRIFLLAFAAISLFVGSFVIFNTISITVAQRTRELATLRTLGASRRQVLRSVLLETAVIGVVASAIGLVLGLGIAAGLKALFGALGVELPKATMVLAPRTVVVALVAGTLVTLLAGLFPALRATSVAPISAVREGATLPRSRYARLRPYLAALTTLLGLIGIAVGMSSGGSAETVLTSLGLGTLLLFIGVAMMSSHVVTPLARIVGLRPGGWAARPGAWRRRMRFATRAAPRRPRPH